MYGNPIISLAPTNGGGGNNTSMSVDGGNASSSQAWAQEADGENNLDPLLSAPGSEKSEEGTPAAR